MSFVIEVVVEQHAEEAAFLWFQRSNAVHQPHFALQHLARLDERVAAHLDGLVVARESGANPAERLRTDASVGSIFAEAAVSLLTGDKSTWNELFHRVTTATPQAEKELASAVGWVKPRYLQGLVKSLLDSKSPQAQRLGISACGLHRVNPGPALHSARTDEDPSVRARAFRMVGELGLSDFYEVCRKSLDDSDPACQFWAAWSATLLRGRTPALDVLLRISRLPGLFRQRAMQLALSVADLPTGHAFLQDLAANPKDQRELISAAGIVGDPHYIPWLIKQMDDPKLSRLAGQGFSFITGLDLAYLDLERNAPEDVSAGPTEAPDDDNVAMDPDDSLPWPDPAKIRTWWEANQTRFPSGQRFFMGEPISVENCKRVLTEGYQRQRIAAALYLSLSQSNTVLFPTSAPAWRQQRLLAGM